MARRAILAALSASLVLCAHAQFQAPASSGPFSASLPQLGPAPRYDPSAPPPAPAIRPKTVAAVPAIDTTNRAAVVSAYNAYFSVAAPALAFTGSVPGCNAGSISSAFQDWFITRLNFLRAMAGVPGNMANDSSKNAQEQAAALVMDANRTLTHAPDPSMTCYTQASYDGASSSNIAIYAPDTYDALMLYMSDFGGGNAEAGHRRWILHSAHSTFAVGQTSDGSWGANALYAFGIGTAAAVPNGVPWPPRGYVPMALFPDGGGASPRWSFGLPNADFSAASVTMTVNGAPLAVNVVSRTDNGYGDNTIVWELPSGYSVVKGSTYGVSIAGIGGVSPGAYSYQVLAFDPADPPPAYALTVTRSGTGAGTVTSAPAGINCGATCSANIADGTSVTLTAAAAGGSVFAGWTGACFGSGPCTVTANAAASVDALFVPVSSGLVLNPSTLAFGGQSMNTTSPTQSVLVTNASAQTQQLGGIGTTDVQFVATPGCGTSLASGASCVVDVSFTPNVAAGALLSTTAASGTLTVPANPALGSVTNYSLGLTGTGEKSLVSHYYRSLLGRAADPGGKTFWEGEAVRVNNLGANVNEAWFALAITFVNSPEYSLGSRSDTQFTTDLYRTFYNRAPDAGGLAYWSGQLASGLPREVLLAAFLFSPEFASFMQQIFGNTTVRAELNTVMDFYRGLLGRLPDDSGFNFWLQQFRAAQCQNSAAVTAKADSISSAFVNSGEYAARGRSNAQYVGDLYNAFLRRGGDLGGVQFWIGQLDSGVQTREQLRQAFVASPEFQARVAAVIAEGCSP